MVLVFEDDEKKGALKAAFCSALTNAAFLDIC